MLKRLFGTSVAPQPPIVTQVVSSDVPHSSQVYLEAARNTLDTQLRSAEALGGTSAQYLSVASLALPVTYALLRQSSNADPLPEAARILLFAALGAYLLVLFFALRASSVGNLEYRPNITTLKEHSQNYTGVILTQWIANEIEASIRENIPVVRKKARLVAVVALFVFVETLCLSVAAVVVLL